MLSHLLVGPRVVGALILVRIALTLSNLGDLEELRVVQCCGLIMVVDLVGLSLLAELCVVISMVVESCNG